MIFEKSSKSDLLLIYLKVKFYIESRNEITKLLSEAI